MKYYISMLLIFCASLHPVVKKSSFNEPVYAIPPPEFSSKHFTYIINIDIAYTFLVPNQQNMILVMTDLVSQDLTNNPLFIAKNWIEPEFEGKNGFKAGLGCNCFHDGWTLNALYSWFYNNSPMKKSHLEITNWKYESPWLYPMGTYLSTFSSSFSNQFNQISVTLKRPFFAGNFLIFSPFAGLIRAWEKQYLNVYGESINQGVDNPTEISTTHQKTHFGATGLYGGINASYFFTKNWAIKAHSGASLNFSRHKAYAEYIPIKTTNPSKKLITSTNYFNIDPMFESSIGLRWDCLGENFTIILDAVWENQIWFSHNCFIKLNSTARDGFPHSALPYAQTQAEGNYSMQGLSAKISLLF